MPIENHSLANELPEFKDRIHELKQENMHFHRIESGAENTSDEYLEGLKKQRLSLKDELFAMLNTAPA